MLLAAEGRELLLLRPARQASDEARSSQHPSNLQNVTTACDELDLNKIEFTEEIEFLEAVSLTGPNSSAPNPVKTGYKTPFCRREKFLIYETFSIFIHWTIWIIWFLGKIQG